LGDFTALPRHPGWIKGSLLLREGDEKGVDGKGRREKKVRVEGPLYGS